MKVYTINPEQYRQGWAQMWDEARRENQQEEDIAFHTALRSLETLKEAYGMDFSQAKNDIREQYDACLKVRDEQPYEVDMDRDEDGMPYYEEDKA